MKMSLLLTVAAVAASVTVRAQTGTFRHELKGDVKPWTSEAFLDDPEEFHFAIVGDRAGGERNGIFGKTMDALNLLRPAFAISVGDLIACGGRADADKQWKELEETFLSRLEMPFFHVVGNHDVWTGFTGMTPERRRSIDLWKANCGTNTYYSFVYKGCHFVCFDTMERHDYFPPREPLSAEQVAWALGEMKRHGKARWHFLFMHKPIDWTSDRWLDFERRINGYDYTVFCGDWHNFCTATRHGKKYYMLGTCGGGWDGGVTQEDLRYGIMDAITWVTMTKDRGPVVSYLRLSGIFGDTVQTCATTRGWIEAPLDYPSHRAEDPALYAEEKNTALIPTEVAHGPGYDWHFRHALILRKGRCLPVGYEKLPKGKKRVVLLGDETASERASAYGDDWCVLDFGFKGDRIENVLWRVVEGELAGYEPQRIVLSVGRHNQGVNTPEEIAAGLRKLSAYVRARCPKAELVCDDGNVRAESPERQAKKRAALEAAKELGPTMTDVEVRRAKNVPGKRAAFYIDDVIFLFRDLARDRPKSCWDHFFLKAIKEAHDKYGLKLQLNVFYRSDFYYGARGAEFTLKDMPDTWKDEFQAAKDWLRFGFHSYSEFPDYPWINAGYDDVVWTWRKLTDEVERFAGPGMFAKAVTPHWGPMSKEGCRALRDCGAKAIWCSAGKRYAYDGDRAVLPYGHAMRIENFRKSETAMYWRAGGGDDISVSACGYNHLLPDQVKVTRGTCNWLHDKETGCNFMAFGCGAPCLNLYRLEDIPARMRAALGNEFLIHATHEEYWYKDYFAYQPDSREKLLTAVKIVHDAGYEYVFIEDKVDW